MSLWLGLGKEGETKTTADGAAASPSRDTMKVARAFLRAHSARSAKTALVGISGRQAASTLVAGFRGHACM